MLPDLREGSDGSAGHRRGAGDARGRVGGGEDAQSLRERQVIQFCGSCPFSGIIAGMGRISRGCAGVGRTAGPGRRRRGHWIGRW